jgi:hypothetical protein
MKWQNRTIPHLVAASNQDARWLSPGQSDIAKTGSLIAVRNTFGICLNVHQGNEHQRASLAVARSTETMVFHHRWGCATTGLLSEGLN